MCLGSSLLETLVICSVCKCDMCPSVRYLMSEEKERFEEVLQALLLESNAKHSPPKQSVKFKCQI